MLLHISYINIIIIESKKSNRIFYFTFYCIINKKEKLIINVRLVLLNVYFFSLSIEAL